MVERGKEARSVSFEPVAEGLAVACGGRAGEELVDDRQVIVERADGTESWSLGIAMVAAGGGEYECGGDDVERDVPLLEDGCQLSIGRARALWRAGDAEVEIEHAPDIGGGHELQFPALQERECLPATVWALSLGLGCEAKTSR
jgi:hypothetical protein